MSVTEIPPKPTFDSPGNAPAGEENETLLQAVPDPFVPRHIGPNQAEAAKMLQALGFADMDAFIDKVVPAGIRTQRPLNLPKGQGEHTILKELRAIAAQNKAFRPYIGMGYSDCIVPLVIQRNILENPGWYTQYTPYQAEISQGRLEAMLNFQTMVADLTALPIANASLLDEATAAAEAMHVCQNVNPDRNIFFVSERCHPQTIAVVCTRAQALGIEVIVGAHESFEVNQNVFGALVQYPAGDGAIFDYESFAEKVHAAGALFVVAADLLALTLLRPPGEFGADIAVGSAQRFGVPLGYGGPHAAYFAIREQYKRLIPGRLVGVAKDAQGRPALRLALQTREQHIRREKATSNICTAQALLASMASMYAVYHGPEGLTRIARRIHLMTVVLAEGLKRLGCEVGVSRPPGEASAPVYFDTLRVHPGTKTCAAIVKLAESRQMNFRIIDDALIGISLDETTSEGDLIEILAVFNDGKPPGFSLTVLASAAVVEYPAPLARTSAFLQHPVFNTHRSEMEILRYMRRLEAKDLSLTTSMIPLGSCTMKLNAAAEMLPLARPEFSPGPHPFAPLSQTRGYQVIFRQLGGMAGGNHGALPRFSLQPNSGAQGDTPACLS